MIAVFAPTLQYVNAYHDWSLDPTKFRRSNDINEVLRQPLKIVCLSVWFDKEINIDASQFDLVLISDIEFNNHYKIYNWISNLNIKNYLIKVGGLDTIPIAPDMPSGDILPNWIYRPFWSFYVLNLLNNKTHRDTNNIDKPYLFDVLLGARRCHRDYIMARFQKSNLLKQSIINYRAVFNNGTNTEPSQQVQEILNGDKLMWPYVSENLNPEWEITQPLPDDGCRIVPWDIYYQTKYSVVCETLWYGSDFFLTEKTTKPLLAKRLFIIISSRHFLKNLKKIGFMTFDGIIDESYDDIKDPYERWSAAVDQMEYLAQQDYIEVSKKIEYIVEHNHNRLMVLQEEINHKTNQMVSNIIKEIT